MSGPLLFEPISIRDVLHYLVAAADPAQVPAGAYDIHGPDTTTYRDLMLVRTGLLDVPPEFLYSHEVVIFLAVMLLLAVILFVVVGPFWMRATGVFFAPIRTTGWSRCQNASSWMVAAISAP